RCLKVDPDDRYGSADELREAFEELTPERHTGLSVIPEGNPYRGLLSFGAEHRALFFGRSVEIRTVVERLRSETLLVVAGDSGVGKSSVCKAGVLPYILEQGLGTSLTWSAIDFVPGKHPLASFAAALAKGNHSEEEALIARMQNGPAEFAREIRR